MKNRGVHIQKPDVLLGKSGFGWFPLGCFDISGNQKASKGRKCTSPLPQDPVRTDPDAPRTPPSTRLRPTSTVAPRSRGQVDELAEPIEVTPATAPETAETTTPAEAAVAAAGGPGHGRGLGERPKEGLSGENKEGLGENRTQGV